MKKSISIMLVAFVMLLSSNALAKDRRGAAVILTTPEGPEVRGELYAVKSDAFVVVDPEGRMTTVPAADVVESRLKKRSGRSVRTGAIIGSAAFVGFAFVQIIANSDGSIGAPQAEEIATLSGLTLLSGAAGGLVGWIAGGASSTKTVHFEGLSAESLQQVLTKLRKSARAPSLR